MSSLTINDLPSCPRSTSPLRPLLAVLVALALPGPVARAQSDPKGALTVTIEQPWVRATPGGAKLTAGYLVIRNTGDTPDRLVGASAEPAGRVSPHTMSMADGVMQMRALPAVVVPAHGTVAFKPGGDHLMLEDLKHPLKAGDRFAGTLTFETAGAIAVTFAVEGVGSKGPTAPKP